MPVPLPATVNGGGKGTGKVNGKAATEARGEAPSHALLLPSAMSVIFIVFPIALLVVAGALVAFIWAARSGQFDDLETPGVRHVAGRRRRTSRSAALTIDGDGEARVAADLTPGDERRLTMRILPGRARLALAASSLLWFRR